MSIVSCVGVRKQFGKHTALAGVDLQIAGQGVFGLLGPNGAGKSTLLRILTGQISHDGGQVALMGRPVGVSREEIRYRFGYLAQQPRYYGWMSGEEFLDFAGTIFGIPKHLRRRRTRELLAMSGLTASAGRKISGYSGGMLQRLGIAQALYNDPEVLFLDEPVSALDPVGRKDVLEFIAGISSRMTVIMSTHILEDVERICSNIAIMESGRILLQGSTAALLEGHAGNSCCLQFAAPVDADRMHALLLELGIDSEIDGAGVVLKEERYRACRSSIHRIIAEQDMPLETITGRRCSLEELFVELVTGGRKYA